LVDLRAPLNHVIDPFQVAEALERTRLVLLSKVAEDKGAQRQTSTVLPWALAKSSGHHRQAKATEGADRAVVLRAATPEAAAPNRLAELAGHAKSWRQRQGWSLRPARRLCTSICGLTT
jgi:hypothetical protein